MSRAYIELIHDEFVNVVWPIVWPGSEPVPHERFRYTDLLESAVSRPFQTFGGEELYPTIFGKAAALFHSLVSNHCFQDGNKRTAVIAIDQFFAVNDYILTLMSAKVYVLAKDVATHNERGISTREVLDHLEKTFEQQAVSFEVLSEAHNPDLVELLKVYTEIRQFIRESPLNQELAP